MNFLKVLSLYFVIYPTEVGYMAYYRGKYGSWKIYK